MALVTDRAQDEATVAWIHTNLDRLRIAGAVVGIILLWWLEVSWLGFLLLVALVGAYELVLTSLAARAASDAPTS